MDTELQVLAEGLVELLEVVLVLGDLLEKIKALLDNVLADDLKDLVLLERLTRDVQRKILGVNNTLYEVEVFWNDILAIIHNEDTADIELNVVALLLRLKEVEGSTANTVSICYSFDCQTIYRFGMKRMALNSS